MKTLLDQAERARIRAETADETHVAAQPWRVVKSRNDPGQPERRGESITEELERKLLEIHYRIHPENDPRNKQN